MIPALVLTAGLATRLRPLSYVRAKAALPVAGEPLACRVLKQLAGAGVTDSVLNLHHLPHTIASLVGNGGGLGLRVRYSWESPVVLGSAGGPRRALPIIGAPTFFIVNGDTLTDVSLGAVAEQHRTRGALVTMAVIPNTEPEKYGGVVVDGDGVVTGFVRRGAPERSYHFIGVQAVEASAFASVPDNVPFESTGRLYPSLIAGRRGAVRAYISNASFLDIGTPADYYRTSLALAGREGEERLHGARTTIAADARVERTVLWDDVSIGAGSLLRDCIVTDGVRVPDGTSWHDAIIRRAGPELTADERRVGDLAISPLVLPRATASAAHE